MRPITPYDQGSNQQCIAYLEGCITLHCVEWGLIWMPDGSLSTAEQPNVQGKSRSTRSLEVRWGLYCLLELLYLQLRETIEVHHEI